MVIDNEYEKDLHLFDIEVYHRFKKTRATNESERRFLEEVRKRSELARKVEEVIDKLRDPYNEKRSEIKMDIYYPNINIEELILLTELPKQVNTTTYFVNSSEFSDYYVGRSRLVKQGKTPKGLYYWLWRSLESNNIWELQNAESESILDISHYTISVSRGDKKHRFSVYAPHFGKELKKHRRIVDRIDWLSYFAFFRVKDVQPFLDEISREEADFRNQCEYLMYQETAKSAIKVPSYPLPDKNGNYPPTN